MTEEKKWDVSFSKVKEDFITIKHHSTSSLIEIITPNHDHIYLDYYEFSALINAINKLTKY